MYQYWGFGLNIVSEIAFPELIPASFDAADLTISIGKVPGKLEGDDVIKKVNISASPKEYLFKLNHVATYYAANGNKIIIEPTADADEKSVRLFMLSNAMAAILHQQNKIPFHASGIITNNGLVLFTGKSGVGKSTTAFSLMQAGYQLFTDDVCVLSENEAGIIEAAPSYPIIKLWENTIDEIGTALDKKHRIRPHLPKYGFAQHDNFDTQHLPVSKVFILKTDNLQKAFTCTPLNKVKSFNSLQQNTYRRKQVDMMQLHPAHFQIISQLSNQVDVYEVSRSSGSTNIPSFIEFIKEHL